MALAAERPVTLVDASVLLDILTEDSTWTAWSESALAPARDDGRLAVNPIVYAEVSTGFDRIEDLDESVPVVDFEREALPYEAGFLAGKAFLTYRKRGGQRRSPLPDFYIGAHAAVRRYRLLTRDIARVDLKARVAKAGHVDHPSARQGEIPDVGGSATKMQNGCPAGSAYTRSGSSGSSDRSRSRRAPSPIARSCSASSEATVRTVRSKCAICGCGPSGHVGSGKCGTC